MKRILKIILAFLFLVTFSCSLYQWSFRGHPHRIRKEVISHYDSTLIRIRSVDVLTTHWDSLRAARGIDPSANAGADVNLLDDIIRRRFYHGWAEYRFQDNYLAWIAGTLFWDRFLAVVIPNDILKANRAMCSQQAIVLQEILKRAGYKVRTVRLKGHFCSEVYYDGAWHFYDPDFEPVFDSHSPVPGTQELLDNPELIRRAYTANPWRDTLAAERYFVEEFVRYSPVNEYPAPNMRLFHTGTKWLSDILWLVFLFPALSLFKRPEP